jgi:hypothetical protein
MCYSSGWQSRRMVYTKRLIAFARNGKQDVIDIIPLDEIISLKDMAVKNDQVTGNDDEEEGISDVMVQLETRPDGYNSGRTYQIRSKSTKNVADILHDLCTLSKSAKERAAAKSKFRTMQGKVANIFNSDFVQRVLAFLIFAVCCILH